MPGAGTYLYSESTDIADPGQQPINGAQGSFKLVVESRRGASQRVLSYDGGADNPSFDVLRWAKTELVDVAQGFDSRVSCSYQPPLVRLSFPLQDGKRWGATTKCGQDTAHYQVALVSHHRESFPGRGELTIWLVRTTATIDVGFVPGVSKVTLDEQSYLAPSLLAPVRLVSTTRSYDGNKETHYERVTRTLTSSH